jgi:hypothetical protein
MLELLAVACLSIAAKMEEVEVPLLRDLQVRRAAKLGSCHGFGNRLSFLALGFRV